MTPKLPRRRARRAAAGAPRHAPSPPAHALTAARTGGAPVTEAGWLECDDSKPMLEFVRGRTSDRKLRLFAVGCCWPLWPWMTERCCQDALLTAERFADGLSDRRDLAGARKAMKADFRNRRREAIRKAALDETGSDRRAAARATGWAGAWDAAHAALRAGAYEAASNASLCAWVTLTGSAEDGRLIPGRELLSQQSRLLRCVIGNPFRPGPVDPALLTATVTGLAAVAYDERALPSGELDPQRLAVLADALEEAGCTDPDLLGHLRSPGAHVRGCWALDLVLGKG